ncbi:MAG TPA: hypothetical protein VG123_33085 [Streptosporangiaceae bacterium]|jgi:hypothetical protein|nr:hypothetical protein [Streptosporangiaceae bacterium]
MPEAEHERALRPAKRNTRFWLARNKIASRHPATQIGGYLRAGLGPALVAQRDLAASPCDAGRLYAVVL